MRLVAIVGIALRLHLIFRAIVPRIERRGRDNEEKMENVHMRMWYRRQVDRGSMQFIEYLINQSRLSAEHWFGELDEYLSLYTSWPKILGERHSRHRRMNTGTR